MRSEGPLGRFNSDTGALTMTQLAILQGSDTTLRGKWWMRSLFLAILVAGFLYVVFHLAGDLGGVRFFSVFPFVLLGIALLIALGFEFVNGFHDTANAVATVIYTHSLKPNIAVIWSGLWNFLGVLVSSGAVAFGIVSLLPVELILQVGSHAGFAMVFALLLSAMIWNLGTWSFGLPSSSSHTLIGSIIGVGLANQLLFGASRTSGVDWSQAANIGKSLLFSPVIGFALAAILLLLAKWLVRLPSLYRAPEGHQPPPVWIRGLLILTCTGVSFAHGSNDGQKGMGLIMLILIGTVPTAYALNHAVGETGMANFMAISQRTLTALEPHRAPGPDLQSSSDPRALLTQALQAHATTPATVGGLHQVIDDIAQSVATYKSLASVSSEQVQNVRNDMYLAGETLRLFAQQQDLGFTPYEQEVLKQYKAHLDKATKFIPIWVKVAVAIALGMGTMIGWKRIVITVGEKIGKQHLTYAQGASAELVAMSTIGAADIFGLPVSTTHVLSSGVAGTMVANRSGLQWGTIRNLLLAWVLTFPVSIALSGSLFWLLRQLL